MNWNLKYTNKLKKEKAEDVNDYDEDFYTHAMLIHIVIDCFDNDINNT